MQTQTMTQKKADFQAAGARRAERREKTRSTAKAAGSGRWFLIGFAIPALIMLIGYIQIGVWPFGDGTVLIIDSLHQYLPFYTEFHEKLVHHSSLLYSFSAGLGYNFWATYAYYLASPLNFLIGLVPTANVCDFMDYLILLKVALCGGTMTWYLHRRNPKSGLLAPAFGTMYAVSFFMIGYYFNIMWLDSIAMLPLIMKGIEQIFGIGDGGRVSGRSDGRLYGTALFVALWCNYYIGFMLCLFSVLYVFVCLVYTGRMKPVLFLRRTLRFFWYSLLAGGMGSIVLLPAYRALKASESMQSNTFPKVIKFYTDFVNLCLAHFAGIKPVNISNSQVGLNAYCGVSVMLLGILFLLDSQIAFRRRIAKGVLAGFLFLSFSMNVLNYIWHGFHQQNGLPNRFAFIYIAIVLVMSFDAIKDVPKLAVWRIIAAGVIPVSFAAVAWYLKLGQDNEGNAYPVSAYEITFLLLCGYLVLLLVIRLYHIRRLVFSVLAGSILICESGVSAVWGIVCNDSVTRSIYLNDQKSYKTLVPQMHDNTWFRSEVDSQRMRDVTLFCGGNAVVMFNSTMQESVTNFCDRIGMESRTNKNGYNGVTKLMNDVLGIKYVLSAQGTGSTLYQFQKQTSDGNLTIYKNENALALGFMVNPEIRDWDISSGTPIDVQNDFVVKAAGLEPIYTLDRYLTMQNGEANEILIPDGKQVYAYLPERVAELKLTTPEFSKTYETFTDHLYVINAADGENMAQMTASTKLGSSAEAIIYTCPDSAEQAVVDRLRESELQNVSASGNVLTGDINVKKAGVLLLTLPYDNGWRLYVDGKKVKLSEIGSCLMGADLETGQHAIRMVYVPEGFREGILLTIVSGILFALSLYLYSRRHRGEKKGFDRDMDDAKAYLSALCGEDAVAAGALMSAYTTFRIGGPAALLVKPKTERQLADTILYLRRMELPYFVVGNGSNLLVSDAGYRGVIVRVAKNLSQIRIQGDIVEAQAGAMLSAVAAKALEVSLAGMECVSGIPGTIGGAVFMNAGAYGGEMKDIVESVHVLTRDGKIIRLSNEDCSFGYRTSRIQTEGMTVLDVSLKLEPGDPLMIREKMDDLRARRAEKQPLEYGSAGSTFKRPEGHYAGALIDEAGMRGFTVGGAMVSEKHAGFVVNVSGATAEDVRGVIRGVQEAVMEKSGVKLEPEVQMLGFEDTEDEE
ncbi:UDP-N-acetylmuramate dehydrogenase [Porcincola intestinalis]|uniref:UDP-N-acetylenolpyruvoylglucosamine reductase n=1 Tax=Porcincola intestinalis TaxID=2606632 RepID=A0A6L5X214_9FIRM|nr:UDP-N-acetylmuramate dehydrogenase [Porcincola intestinalis]MSS13507.1 UDP-N-acetylmuramate dehydrogenase [Porcincola intestinalis]